MHAATLGDCLEITFPAVGVVCTAFIVQVVPSVNPMTRTFSVIVSLPNGDHALPPGMFAKARIVDASACPVAPSDSDTAKASTGATP